MADHNMEIFYNFVELFASCHQASFHRCSVFSMAAVGELVGGVWD